MPSTPALPLRFAIYATPVTRVIALRAIFATAPNIFVRRHVTTPVNHAATKTRGAA